MSDIDNNQPVKFALIRWLAVIPCALLAGFLGAILFIAFRWLNKMSASLFGFNSWVAESSFVLELLEGGVIGAGFVLGGALVAPYKNKETAFSLFGASVVICLALLLWIYTAYGGVLMVGFLTGGVGLVAGSLIAAVSIK